MSVTDCWDSCSYLVLNLSFSISCSCFFVCLLLYLATVGWSLLPPWSPIAWRCWISVSLLLVRGDANSRGGGRPPALFLGTAFLIFRFRDMRRKEGGGIIRWKKDASTRRLPVFWGLPQRKSLTFCVRCSAVKVRVWLHITF